MTKVNVNIEQFRTYVSDFDKCVQTLESSINSFFDEINQFDGWSGDISNKFLSNINVESNEYNRFVDSLNSFISILNDMGDNLESVLISSRRE